MRIRPIVLCLLQHENRILFQEYWHEFDQYHFYRLPGGGIEYGEKSIEAVAREAMEELQTTLLEPTLLNIFENIFEYGGETKHEVVFLYSAQLPDNQLTKSEVIEFFDNGLPFRGVWIAREAVLGGEHVIYPVAFRQMILEGKI